MIDINEINNEISRLEYGNTTYSTCEKLSVLYTVRDKLQPEEPPQEPERYVPRYSSAQSEFVQLASGLPVNEVLNVIDEHLEGLRLVYPKEYDIIIRKLSEI